MTIDWRQSYNDLCKEIEILELRASDLEFQMRIAKSICFRGFVTDQYSRIPLDKALGQYDDVKDELLSVVAMLEHKQQTKQEMERRMNAFDGLEYKVAYMRDIQGKFLDQIADELGYSLDWIKKVSRRTSMKALRRHSKVASF
jgi:DNA-directed RNA polymerase specialized sigma24 family protein